MVSRLTRVRKIQWWCSVFPFSIGNTIFEANLVPKFKIVYIRWNLVPREIQMFKLQCWFSLFLFLTRNTLFVQILSRKTKIVSLNKNFIPTLLWISRIRWWSLLFLYLTRNLCPFGSRFVFKGRLVTRLIQIYRVQWKSSVFKF